MNNPAIQRARPVDVPPFDRAPELLRSRAARDRLRGVLSLADRDSQGFDLLVTALGDRNRQVRLAAATVLGEWGDPRAVPALRAALRRCLVGGTGGRQQLWARAARAFGWMASLLVVLAIGPLWRSDSAPIAVPLGLAVAAVGLLLSSTSFAWAKRRENLRNAILVALCRIAENGGGREVKSCLPDLEALAASRWGQSPGGRAGLATALQYLRTLPGTEPHPIPAEAPSDDSGDYPRPAGSSTVTAGKLPVPSKADPP